MRSISAALDAAQRQASRDPAISAVVRNDWEAVRRLDFSTLNDTVNTSGAHDVAVDGEGNVHRVRVDAGTIKHQKLTPAQQDTDANWDVWTDLVTGMGNKVAIAARGTRVFVTYLNNINNQSRYKESTDYGATFGADTANQNHGSVVQDMAAAYKNDTGDLISVVVTAADTIHCRKRTAGAFAANVNSGVVADSLNGIAATFALDYEILVTGVETATLRSTVWSTKFLDATNLWDTLRPQFQSEGTLSGFAAPSLAFFGTWRACFVELPSFSGGLTRCYRTYLHPLESWNRAAFIMRAALPTDVGIAAGLAVASGGSPGYFWETSYERVRRAPTALVTLDVSRDLQALELVETTLDAYGWIDLVNPDDPTARRYALPHSSPLQIGNMVRIGLGYVTAGAAAIAYRALLTTTSASPRTSTRRTAGAWGALKTMPGITDNNPRPFSMHNNVILVTNGSGVPARSADGGDTWAAMPASIAGANWFSRGRNGRYWCVVRDVPDAVSMSVWYSDDEGVTWINSIPNTGFNTRRPFAIAAHPNTNVVVVNGVTNTGAAFTRRTLDNGAIWTEHTGGTRPIDGQLGVTEMYDFRILDSGRMIATGPIASGFLHRVYVSDDNAATWTEKRQELTQYHYIARIGISGQTIKILRTDQTAGAKVTTILTSTDGGDNWSVVSTAPTLQGFTSNVEANPGAADYDVASDTFVLRGDTTNFAIVSLTPATAAGVYADIDAGIPSTSFGNGNIAVIPGVSAQAGGPETEGLQDFWITAAEIHHDERRGRARLRLHLEGGLRRLKRLLQYGSISHTADDYRNIISGIMARAGLSLSVTNASARSDTIIPRFTIDPNTTAHAALRAALAFIADRCHVDQGSSVNLQELVSGESADYSLGNEYPDDPTEHPITRLRLRSAPPPAGEVHVEALTAALAYLHGQATDHETADYALAPLARLRDFTSDAISEADETADTHIRQLRFDRDDGTLWCPPIINLQLLDVLELTDPYAYSIPNYKKRVSEIRWRLDRTALSPTRAAGSRRRTTLFEQEISLAPATDQDTSTGVIE